MRAYLLKTACCGLLALAVGAAWVLRDSAAQESGKWLTVAPGVLRSHGLPCAHALTAEGKALLIDAPYGADVASLKVSGVEQVELVLLTHHHWDTVARAAELVGMNAKVRAPKASAEWLLPEGVARYWRESLPLRNSRTAYLVVPEGVRGIDCSLEPGQKFTWRGWEIEVIATPGHSRDHLSFLARRDGRTVLFAGDALSAPGKIWSPYTTDWDHWTDAGLKPAAESLRKLAAIKPDLICPAHGAPISTDTVGALEKTAKAADEVGFLKSFERFSKERLGNAPTYQFLAREQAGTGGDKPWSRVGDYLYVTGNTWVLVSKDNKLMVMDPWGKRSVEQIARLQKERSLGPVELVMFSHAHYDHYDGIYDLGEPNSLKIWALDRVADPIADPFYYRAPFLDVRPVRFDRRFKDGESGTWREYTFRFHHFPGQTYFTMAVEVVIGGRKCVFTGDNFFHIDLYSGTGGWMGLNRSWPGYYADSARKLLALQPEWVLAEHGGGFEFNEVDVRRREQWGRAGEAAADALSPSGNHRMDWDPHRVHVEPVLVRARAGGAARIELVAQNFRPAPEGLTVTLEGRQIVQDLSRRLSVSHADPIREPLTLQIHKSAPAGRHVFRIRALNGDTESPADTFVAVEVEP